MINITYIYDFESQETKQNKTKLKQSKTKLKTIFSFAFRSMLKKKNKYLDI